MSTAQNKVLSDDPVTLRHSERYQQEYVHSCVEKWDELIVWDSRAKSEGRLFIDQLKERGAEKILDVATGTEAHSVRLLQEGFEVLSADGSPETYGDFKETYQETEPDSFVHVAEKHFELEAKEE